MRPVMQIITIREAFPGSYCKNVKRQDSLVPDFSSLGSSFMPVRVQVITA
jgi:hypothetical protein